MSVEKDVSKFVGDKEKLKKKGSLAPPPPKKGEVMVCTVCGKEMLPEDFSEDKLIRKREFKWHCHWDCQQAKLDECDRKTPGLLSERNN